MTTRKQAVWLKASAAHAGSDYLQYQHDTGSSLPSSIAFVLCWFLLVAISAAFLLFVSRRVLLFPC